MSSGGARALVTGGAGFIGSHLVRRLLESGWRVRIIDDFSTGLRERVSDVVDQIELIEATVTDRTVCARAMEGVDTVFHQAALPSVERSVRDPLASHEVDATGTLNLLVAARDAGIRRFIYAASSSAYGDTEVLPKSEDLPTLPRSPYAVAKLTGELYTRLFASVYALETVALRYFNVFGPWQDPDSHYAAVVPLFIRSALRAQSPIIHSDGQQTRDFTYIGNVVNANMLACDAPADKVSGEVFNVGCGRRISINDLWHTIRDLAGASVEPCYRPSRPGDVRDSMADLDRVRRALGYSPTFNLREGLAATVNWYRETDWSSAS